MNSFWVPFLIAISPIIGIGLIVGLIILLLYNSREISDPLSYGMAKRRGISRRRGTVLQLLVTLAAWLVALETLIFKCGGVLSCQTPQHSSKATDIPNAITGITNTNSNIPIIDAASQFSGLVLTNWVYAAFLGLLVVASVIVGRAFVLSWQESRQEDADMKAAASEEAASSVQDALRILRADPASDPRMRIINCYQRMVIAAQRMGARVSSDQTARELKAAIHAMLGIKGSSLRELTDLFEEARYSVHQITEDDALKAENCLLGIAQELKIVLSV